MSVPGGQLENKIERGLKQFIDARAMGLIPTTYTGLRNEELPLPRTEIIVTDVEAMLWSPSVYRVTVEITVRHRQNAIPTRTATQESDHDWAWGQLCDVLNTIPINVPPFNVPAESDGLAYNVTTYTGAGHSMQLDAAREIARRRFIDDDELCSMVTLELIANTLGSTY